MTGTAVLLSESSIEGRGYNSPTHSSVAIVVMKDNSHLSGCHRMPSRDITPLEMGPQH